MHTVLRYIDLKGCSEMTNQCKKCKKLFVPQSGLKSYCSLACRNSRTFSEETKMKKSTSAKAHWSGLSSEKRAELIQKIADSETRNNTVKQTWIKKFAEKSWDELGNDGKRRRVFEEQNLCCKECGISDWRGQPLSLELNHIDGNNQNYVRENLEALCPNCHSITPNWRGRNKNGVLKSDFTPKVFMPLFEKHGNIHKTLQVIGVTPKGGNYRRAKEFIQLMASEGSSSENGDIDE